VSVLERLSGDTKVRGLFPPLQLSVTCFRLLFGKKLTGAPLPVTHALRQSYYFLVAAEVHVCLAFTTVLFKKVLLVSILRFLTVP